jgi:Tol biopolymer transport system component
VIASPQAETYPVWAPDSDHFVFSRGSGLFVASINTGREALLINRKDLDSDAAPLSPITAMDWSSNGYMIVRLNRAKTGFDLLAMAAEGHQAIPIAQTAANERDGQFSADGKWVAYGSDETGRSEIYVQRFPEGTNKARISVDGGAQPRWRGDGRELYYVALDGRLMAASITLPSTGTPETGAVTRLFMTHIGGAIQAAFRQQYVVSSDGQKFLMNNIVDETSTTPITVLLNWHR